MLKTYEFPQYDYVRSTDQDSQNPIQHPVVIIGAGPIGLAAAVDFSIKGIPVVVIDDNNTVSVGSRAVCYAKRFLDISDRLGVGERLVNKGVTWNVGKVFFDTQQIYQFNMLPEDHHRRPGFINLQQYYLEQYYVERLTEFPSASLRWKNKLIAVEQNSEHATLTIDTPEGTYQLAARYVLACDGANSATRKLCGLESKGQIFEDRFLIADILMEDQYFPQERWFWFNPPFHEGSSTLLHRQPDNLWRIDFDLGWDANPEIEKKPENIIPRVKAFLGDDIKFELEWSSVYTFTCRRMDSFKQGRLFFAGDSAHQVSPFGARGANSGIEDIDNLVWKIQLDLNNQAGPALLDSYSTERVFAADENILNSTRSTDFITPKNAANKILRDAVLSLAKHYEFARPLVNSGRLSVPPILDKSPLVTSDADTFSTKVCPGSPCTDGPIILNQRKQFLLSNLGNQFELLWFFDNEDQLSSKTLKDLQRLQQQTIAVKVFAISKQVEPQQQSSLTAKLATYGVHYLDDVEGVISQRLDTQAGTFYLLRPDQIITGRGRKLELEIVFKMLQRATGFTYDA